MAKQQDDKHMSSEYRISINLPFDQNSKQEKVNKAALEQAVTTALEDLHKRNPHATALAKERIENSINDPHTDLSRQAQSFMIAADKITQKAIGYSLDSIIRESETLERQNFFADEFNKISSSLSKDNQKLTDSFQEKLESELNKEDSKFRKKIEQFIQKGDSNEINRASIIEMISDLGESVRRDAKPSIIQTISKLLGKAFGRKDVESKQTTSITKPYLQEKQAPLIKELEERVRTDGFGLQTRKEVSKIGRRMSEGGVQFNGNSTHTPTKSESSAKQIGG